MKQVTAAQSVVRQFLICAVHGDFLRGKLVKIFKKSIALRRKVCYYKKRNGGSA